MHHAVLAGEDHRLGATARGEARVVVQDVSTRGEPALLPGDAPLSGRLLAAVADTLCCGVGDMDDRQEHRRYRDALDQCAALDGVAAQSPNHRRHADRQVDDEGGHEKQQIAHPHARHDAQQGDHRYQGGRSHRQSPPDAHRRADQHHRRNQQIDPRRNVAYAHAEV